MDVTSSPDPAADDQPAWGDHDHHRHYQSHHHFNHNPGRGHHHSHHIYHHFNHEQKRHCQPCHFMIVEKKSKKACETSCLTQLETFVNKLT